MRVYKYASLLLATSLAIASAENKSEELEKITEVTDQKEKTHQCKAWLGVLGDPASAALKAHLSLESGLVLKHVAPNSPAANAGLKKYDVIEKINGIEIENQMGLKKVIKMLNTDDEIKLNVFSGGKEAITEIVLCENPHNEEKGKEKIQFEAVEKFLRDKSETIASQENGERTEETNFRSMLKSMAHKGVNLKSSSAVKVSDSLGSVEIHTINGKHNVIVRNKSNEIQFQGPWNNDDDYAQAQPELKARIDHVSNRSKAIKLQF